MKPTAICQTLKTVSSFEDVVNSVAVKDMPVKKACVIGANSIEAWGVVMKEFNDVITALEGSKKLEDQVCRASFLKALEIVMRASHYKREKVS